MSCSATRERGGCSSSTTSGGWLRRRSSRGNRCARFHLTRRVRPFEPLYPSIQARAAHLLYFLIKDHPFLDGNKRIGTLLFLDYLRRNGMLLRQDGTLRLADNAMVALALLIAESEARHKELMIRLTLSLLEDKPS